MPYRPYFPLPTVKVGASQQELADEHMDDIQEIVVEQSLLHADMFEITFRDEDANKLSDAGLSIGTEVKLECVTADEGGGVLIAGEVTAVEARLDDNGSVTVVRGYDKAHRLFVGKHTETYKNVKISDVAGQIASRANLQTGQIDDSGTVLDVVSQHNQSDWEFLAAHASEIGFEVMVQEGKLFFRKPSHSEDAPTPADIGNSNLDTLVFGDDLLAFRPRISGAQQVGTVEVRSWDPSQKQAIVSTADAAADHANLDMTPSSLASSFGSKTHSHVATPHRSQGQTDKEAASIAQELGSSFAEADGTCLGTPHVHAGAKIAISRVGDQFTGKYTITTAQHTFDSVDGYLTHFTISGRQDRSMVGLATGAAGRQPDFHGVVCAQVTDNNDPDKHGRLKLKFPWLNGTYETDWVRQMHPGAGPQSGIVWIPQKDDEVLVAFEHGDMRAPYVLGPLFNGVDTPLLGDGLFDSGKVKRRGMISRRGHKMIFFDDDSKAGFCVITSDNNLKLTMNETGKKIVVKTSKHTITLDDQANKVTIESGADMDVKAGSSGTLTLSGQTVKIAANGGNVEVTGTQIKLN
jgi:uncharacterized protein involved in type VI secretion and phage assembly